MVGRTEYSEDIESMTVSELVFSLKSEFQHSYYSRVEQILVGRENKLKKEIEEKRRENQLLLENFLRFQKEYGELREQRHALFKENPDADNRRPLSENVVEIIDTDGESASPESAREGHLDKPDLAANEPVVHKRKWASSVDVDDGRPTGRDKRVNVEEPVVSTGEHRSPAAPNLETHYTRNSDLSKILSELDDSSSSSSSDDEVDLSFDYSTLFRT
ncbi:hypothetical protein M5689_020187 [Euphorbia peplus]|nr:hypothetical protein M5689_020187 [Euphorbia peplus]